MAVRVILTDESYPQISNRGRYSISNTHQQLTICQQMFKIWCIHLFLFCNVVKKIGTFIVYSLSFNLADLNWLEDQSTSFRYLWSYPISKGWLIIIRNDVWVVTSCLQIIVLVFVTRLLQLIILKLGQLFFCNIGIW